MSEASKSAYLITKARRTTKGTTRNPLLQPDRVCVANIPSVNAIITTTVVHATML